MNKISMYLHKETEFIMGFCPKKTTDLVFLLDNLKSA